MMDKHGVNYGFDGVDDAFVRRERAKARELRRTRWWKNKIAQGECYYCGRKCSRTALTMDHIVSLARGGMSTKDNIVPACKTCNNKKKHLLPIEWDEYMEALDR